MAGKLAQCIVFGLLTLSAVQAVACDATFSPDIQMLEAVRSFSLSAVLTFSVRQCLVRGPWFPEALARGDQWTYWFCIFCLVAGLLFWLQIRKSELIPYLLVERVQTRLSMLVASVPMLQPHCARLHVFARRSIPAVIAIWNGHCLCIALVDSHSAIHAAY